MFNKTIQNIDENDINNLISNQVVESLRLEYKSRAYGNSDNDIREMLKDISSIANSYGGYLIIGINENNNIPTNTVNVPNIETERDRMQSSCLSNLSPRINSIKFKIIELSNHDKILIIFIPRSVNSPHMVTFKGLNQFWIRHDRQKSCMSTDEIRDACLKNLNLSQTLKEFITNRNNECLEEFNNQPNYVIGASPIVTNQDIVDILDQNIRNMLKNLPEQTGSSKDLNFHKLNLYPEPTFNGLKIQDEDKKVEIFRNGYLELNLKIGGELGYLLLRRNFDIGDRPNIPVFNPVTLVEYTVNFFRLSKGFIEYLGLTEQFFVYLNLKNINSFGLHRDMRNLGGVHPSTGPKIYSKKHIEIAPFQIETLDNPDYIAKILLDRVWNAFGYDNAPLFNSHNIFSPPS